MSNTSATETTVTPIKVRKLGHFVYEVTDVERSERFWTEIMGFKVTERNAKNFVFLRCNTDHHSIALVPTTKAARAPSTAGVQVHHLAMEVDDMDALFKARAFLRERGVPITFEGRHGGGNNVGIEFTDPDGYTFELYCWMDQIGPDGRVRPKELCHVDHSLEDVLANPVPERW